jgi:hypothetical protein
MKKIQLNISTIDNAGNHVSAGETLSVGKEAEMIAADRAKALVDRGSAVSVTDEK